MRLHGMSLRTVFTRMGEESLYKGLERADKTGKVSAYLKNRVMALVPEAFGNDLDRLLEAAHASMHPAGQPGQWQAFFLGASHIDHGGAFPWPRSAQYILDIEHASREATMLFDTGQGELAAEYLARHSLLSAFLTPELCRGMAQATSISDLFLLRVTISLEVCLSSIALWDIESRPNDSDDARSYVTRLLDQNRTTTRNSAAQLFHWVMTTAGVKSTAALMADPRLRDFSVQIGTLGSWSRGTHFPSISYGTACVQALLSPEDAADFKMLFAASRQLNFLGYIAQRHEEMLESLEMRGDARPRPPKAGLPFGHDSIEDWMSDRYQIWLRFHRASFPSQNRVRQPGPA